MNFRSYTLAPWLIAVLVGAVSCAAPKPPPPPPPRVPEVVAELAEIRDLLWQGRAEEAELLLEDRAWSAVGSIAAERLRQDLLLGRGERVQLTRELESALARDGASADLQYLSARILSDPVRRLEALEVGAHAHPEHPWLALGAAAVQQEFGRWDRAEFWLTRAPVEAASAPFRRILLARQLAQAGNSWDAWRLLSEDAFVRGHREALLECLRITERPGYERRRARAAAEFALRASAAESDRGIAMDRVIERFLADDRLRGASLDQVLSALDTWSARAGVPTGWSVQPRYSIGDAAEMVQPESFRGGVSSAWLDHGRFLLIGRAPGRGVDWLYLQNAHRLALPLREGLPAVEVIVAQRGMEPEDRTIPGGAPFHGFFVRLDLVATSAAAHAREIRAIGAPSGWTSPSEESLLAGGRFEAFDLATRLRARRSAAGGATVQDLELLHLVLHECGHLPETLPWARNGVPLLGVAPAVFRSLWHYDDPILFLEERAQLRALASGVETEWAFAELLDRALTPRDPYYRPYRALLGALLDLGQSAGFPPLHAWDQLPPARIAGLARRLLAERSLQPLPAKLAASALRGLDASDSFEQLPVQDLAAALEHDRKIDS